jgi:hypothetical protein
MKHLIGMNLSQAKEALKQELGVKRMGDNRFQALLNKAISMGQIALQGDLITAPSASIFGETPSTETPKPKSDEGTNPLPVRAPLPNELSVDHLIAPRSCPTTITDDIHKVNAWLKDISEEARWHGITNFHATATHPEHPQGGGSVSFTQDDTHPINTLSTQAHALLGLTDQAIPDLSEVPRLGDLYHYRTYQGNIVQGEVLGVYCFMEVANPDGSYQTVSLTEAAVKKNKTPKPYSLTTYLSDNRKLTAERDRLLKEIEELKALKEELS